MNFYLDFEATQFTAEILSVGCVAENGDSFYSLVKPSDRRSLTRFITRLTGITPAMINEAPDPTEVFIKLQKFIRDHLDNRETFFFAYGTGDSIFLNQTARHIEDKQIQEFVYCLGESLIDYSKIVCRFFDTGLISLKKVMAYFEQQPIVQNHNALEDAEMLYKVASYISHTEKPKENPFAEEMLAREMKQKQNELKNQCQGVIIAKVINNPKAKEKEFTSMKDAKDYVYVHLMRPAVRSATSKKNVQKKIEHSIRTGKPYFNRTWTLEQ